MVRTPQIELSHPLPAALVTRESAVEIRVLVAPSLRTTTTARSVQGLSEAVALPGTVAETFMRSHSQSSRSDEPGATTCSTAEKALVSRGSLMSSGPRSSTEVTRSDTTPGSR